MTNLYEIRKETSFSFYEVSEYEEIPDTKGNKKLISTHWECIFHTENWGDFSSSITRFTGIKGADYRRQKDETDENWLKRLDFLSNLLLKDYGIRSELKTTSFKMIIIVDKSSRLIRPPYAFKNVTR